eukprot:2160760-Pleurochrysis_carterae.AAC.4
MCLQVRVQVLHVCDMDGPGKQQAFIDRRPWTKLSDSAKPDAPLHDVKSRAWHQHELAILRRKVAAKGEPIPHKSPSQLYP